MDSELATILLVDDDPVVRMISRRTLTQAGYAVKEADHGRAAQFHLADGAPSLILLDVVMPEMDGFEFCEWLRDQQAFKRIPVLMMTGLDDNESIHRAFEVGATDFIVKPVNPSILLQRVRFLLRASQILEELAESRESLATAQYIARLGSWHVNFTTRKVTWSEEVFRILEIPEQSEPTYKLYLMRVHREDRKAVQRTLLDSKRRGVSYDFTHRLEMPDGRVKWVNERGDTTLDASGSPLSTAGTIQDITERQQSRETIRYLSSFDTLTSLPNRFLFEQQLERAIGHARRYRKTIAVLHLGMNRFKRINESLGHQAGDALLVQVADRLKAASRSCDFLARAQDTECEIGAETNLARWSGDEFVVLLTDIRMAQDAARVSARFLHDLSEPYAIFGQEVSCNATVGITLFPGDGEDAGELLKNADAAMHFAKSFESGGYGFYKPDMNEQAKQRLALETDLRRALERGEFIPYFQPKVDRTRRIVGAEFLVRWQHPERGLVGPDKFIPLAEESGLIIPLSEWVIDAAAAQLRQWLDAGRDDLVLAINLSPLHFRDPGLLDTVRIALARHHLPENRLELELTEGMLMDDLDETLRLLGKLRETGVRLAIDDFGTGYSSLSYLTRLPIDVLKIDRSFIRHITTEASHMNITRTIIAMAHGLDLEVVAEGVETEEQAELLWRESCDMIQGYLYGRPMPAEELMQRLNSRD